MRRALGSTSVPILSLVISAETITLTNVSPLSRGPAIRLDRGSCEIHADLSYGRLLIEEKVSGIRVLVWSRNVAHEVHDALVEWRWISPSVEA